MIYTVRRNSEETEGSMTLSEMFSLIYKFVLPPIRDFELELNVIRATTNAQKNTQIRRMKKQMTSLPATISKFYLLRASNKFVDKLAASDKFSVNALKVSYKSRKVCRL